MTSKLSDAILTVSYFEETAGVAATVLTNLTSQPSTGRCCPCFLRATYRYHFLRRTGPRGPWQSERGPCRGTDPSCPLEATQTEGVSRAHSCVCPIEFRKGFQSSDRDEEERKYFVPNKIEQRLNNDYLVYRYVSGLEGLRPALL